MAAAHFSKSAISSEEIGLIIDVGSVEDEGRKLGLSMPERNRVKKVEETEKANKTET
jgi:hypothetical protein